MFWQILLQGAWIIPSWYMFQLQALPLDKKNSKTKPYPLMICIPNPRYPLHNILLSWTAYLTMGLATERYLAVCRCSVCVLQFSQLWDEKWSILFLDGNNLLWPEFEGAVMYSQSNLLKNSACVEWNQNMPKWFCAIPLMTNPNDCHKLHFKQLWV